jgi:hypothetical protein
MMHLGRYLLIEACNGFMGYEGVFGDVFIKHVLASMIKKGAST